MAHPRRILGGEMDDELWRWIWLVAALGFAGGEIALGGSFFLLPFAVGAGLASLVSFLGADPWVGWAVFVAFSAVGVAAAYPLRRRLDRDQPQDGIGARRLLGQAATVLEVIPGGPSASGLVRVGREDWRAESADGSPIEAGTTVKVVDVRGTRVVVHPQPPQPTREVGP
jgi:membrane protein implicated in regulation of membrane protease activity